MYLITSILRLQNMYRDITIPDYILDISAQARVIALRYVRMKSLSHFYPDSTREPVFPSVTLDVSQFHCYIIERPQGISIII